MREVLSCLRQLQKVDLDMLVKVNERDKFPAQVRAVEAELADEQDAMHIAQANFESVNAERLEKHQKFKDDDERLKKWERRLNESKNAREASALAREIDAHKRLNAELEEEVLKLMEAEEREKTSLTALSSRIEELEAKLAEERKVCEQKLEELNKEIDVFVEDRKQYVEKLPTSLLRRYDKVKGARGGLAVVAARNGCCTGCNMRLRPQLYNVILKMESLETCPGCKRLLFYEDGLENGEHSES